MMANKNNTTKKTTSKPSTHAVNSTNNKNISTINSKTPVPQTSSAIKTARVLMLLSLLFGAGFVGCFILNLAKIITIPWFAVFVLLIFAAGFFIISLFVVGNELSEKGELDVNQIRSEETAKALEKLNANPTFAKYSKIAEQQAIAKKSKK